MKNFLAALILAGTAATAMAQPAPDATPPKVCLESRDIVSSKSDDGKLLTFKMRDGRIFVNHLQGICSDLRFNGYVWVLHSGDTKVCEREQSLRVLQSGQVCTLGKFDPPTMRKAAAN
jgi:hypothetical protein